MAENRQYDHECKVQAVKLPKEIGILKNIMYGWVRADRHGNLDLETGSQTPQSAMTLNEELIQFRQQGKELEKENSRLKKENDFLEEASEPSEVSKNERMKFIDLKTEDGELKGNIAFFCQVLPFSRQGFYKYLANNGGVRGERKFSLFD